MKEYDIVVVGAGPAGSAAAKSAAENGAKVIILEEHTAVGIPAHCSGGVSFKSSEITRKLLDSIDPRVILREYKLTKVYTPSGKVAMSVPLPPGALYLVDRALLDKELARQAVNSGADLLVNTRVTGLLRQGEYFIGVTTSSNSAPEIYGKVIIAADGINAIQKGIPSWAGLSPSRQDYCSGICFELYRVKDLDPDTVEMHTGAFTESGHMGLLPRDGSSCMVSFDSMEHYYRVKEGKYRLSQNLRDSVPLRIVGFTHPRNLGARLGTIVGNGLLLTGSSAGWRGTVTAYFSGLLAGQAASECVRSGDVTQQSLSRYEELAAEKMPQKGYQFRSKVDAYPFRGCSDNEIEDIMMDMINKGTFVIPP